MVEIIPAILSKSVEDFNKKIDAVRPFVSKVHIDMMDNKFVPNKTLAADEIPSLVKGLDYEFHWMYQDPEPHLKKFPVSLHIINVEILTKERWRKMKGMVKRIGIAINPPTPFSELEPYIRETSEFLVMSVNPGFSNQKYIPEVEGKISLLRKLRPDANIEVDGGIGVGTAHRAVAAGANKLGAASAIFSHDNIKEAIDNILSSVGG